jgi:hypothetical protein
MPLSVLITTSSSTVNYVLSAESIRVQIGRTPMHSPLPGSNPLLIDLGQFKPIVTIIGTCRETTDSDGATAIATKRNLEDWATKEFGNTLTLFVTTDSAGGSPLDTYIGKVQSVTFDREAAVDPVLWNFVFSFATVERTDTS